MKRSCVFCGKAPNAKNREHILPQWLIAHTGGPRRVFRFGFDHSSGRPREYSVNSFTFPACEECNSQFAELESVAKPVLFRLLASEALSKYDFHVLLSWFDKVRVGLWLAFYFLDKNMGGITPRFHIASRMGLHDRMLQIIKVAPHGDELCFRGCDMPAFYYTPSCFSMNVNGYCFINILYPQLFSRRIGFPFIRNSYLSEDGLIHGQLETGTKYMNQPLMPGWFEFEGTKIYLPMFKLQALVPLQRKLYENDYVRANSLDFDHGVGEIFLERAKRATVMPSTACSDWVPSKSYKRESMNPQISVHTIRLQLALDRLSPSLERLPAEQQKWWRETYRTNREYAKGVIGILEQNAGAQIPWR